MFEYTLFCKNWNYFFYPEVFNIWVQIILKKKLKTKKIKIKSKISKREN